MKIVGEVIIAGEDLRTDFESASRIKIAPRITGPFGLKPMCNDVETKRGNVIGSELLSLPIVINSGTKTRLSLDSRKAPVFPCLERPT